MPGISLMRLIRRIIREELRYVHTSLIGQVSAVNDDYTIDVQPLVKRAVVKSDNSGVIYRELPVLPSVPVATARSSSADVAMKLSAGDIVEVRFSMFSMEELLSTDQSDPVEPLDPRMHALEDAIAFPITIANTTLPSEHDSDADYEIIASDVRLGRPSAGECRTLVQDNNDSGGLQNQLNVFIDALETFTDAIKTYIDNGEYTVSGITSKVDYASAVWPPVFPSSPTVQRTTETKAS